MSTPSPIFQDAFGPFFLVAIVTESFQVDSHIVEVTFRFGTCTIGLHICSAITTAFNSK